MNETLNTVSTTMDIQMINWNYKKWLANNSINHGMLITQAQAAKILGKTRGRISQMIREKKLKSFTYEKETPLVSFSEISIICDAENEKIENMIEAQQSSDRHYITAKEAYEEEQERLADLHTPPLSEKDIMEIEMQKENQKKLNEEQKKLQKQIEKLEDRLSIVNNLKG